LPGKGPDKIVAPIAASRPRKGAVPDPARRHHRKASDATHRYQEENAMFVSAHAAQAEVQVVVAHDFAWIAALDQAHARAQHSYFTQYVLTDGKAGYLVIDEGDYGALPDDLEGRVIDAVRGKLSDEF
jgi:hypothetical protein